jgi:hypothetical protein
VVSVLATEPKVCGFKPGQAQRIFKGNIHHSITSFGEEVKPAVLCHEILQHVKEPYRYEKRYFVGKIHRHFSQSFSALLLGVSAGYWWMNQQLLELRWGRTMDKKWLQ